MTSRFLFVRHAAHDSLGTVLAGRMAGVRLSAAGRAQAEALARRMAGEQVAAVQASPRERAQATAVPIAAALGLGCETVEALDEIDFGEWTGRRLEDLENDWRWRAWNERRATAHAPGGEGMHQVQARLLAHLHKMLAVHPGHSLVLVSHGDVIKAAVLHVVGASLDAIGSVEIDPASLTTIVLGDWGGKLAGLNERVAP